MQLNDSHLTSPVVATFCFVAFAFGIGITRFMQAYYLRNSYLTYVETKDLKDINSIESSQVIMNLYKVVFIVSFSFH